MAAKIFRSSLEDQMRNWFIKRMKRMHSKAKNSLLPMMKYGNGTLKKSETFRSLQTANVRDFISCKVIHKVFFFFIIQDCRNKHSGQLRYTRMHVFIKKARLEDLPKKGPFSHLNYIQGDCSLILQNACESLYDADNQ